MLQITTLMLLPLGEGLLKMMRAFQKAGFIGALLLALPTIAATTTAHANPVDVTYTVTGSPDDWRLNFSVTNNLGGTNDIDFFGVVSTTRFISGIPADWSSPISQNNAALGGSSITYNNVWSIDSNDPLVILPGNTLGGFQVVFTGDVAPTSVAWFAAAQNGTYDGGGNFNTSTNPFFEGTVSLAVAAVPGPIVGAGLPGLVMACGGVLALWRRRKAA